MDILSHAAAGAAVGYPVGRPLLGAFFGVLPDLCLGYKRKEAPPALYDVTHSLWMLLLCTGISVVMLTPVPALACLSHLVLDAPTHGKRWAPRLFYPHSYRLSLGDEWEWFSVTWWKGLFITFIWILLCLKIMPLL